MAVYKHAPRWPFERIAWLRNATGVNYALQLMEHSGFELLLPVNDAIGVSELDLIVITSSQGLPVYAGFVDRMAETLGGALVRVSGREWSALLSDRTMPQELAFGPMASGEMVKAIMGDVNGRNPTGIDVIAPSVSTAMPSAHVVNSGSLRQALDDIAALSGWEWSVQYEAGQRAGARLFWQERTGEDLTGTLHLAGPMISSASRDVDVLTEPALVSVIGSSGAFGGRPSAVATSEAVALLDIASVRRPVSADNRSRRLPQESIAGARETVIIDSLLPDGVSVQDRAINELALAQSGREVIALWATAAADWSRFVPGNEITIRLANMQFGEHVVRTFRIYGVQPNEAAGRCELVGKVTGNG